MKKFLILISIFFFCSLAYAIDVGDIDIQGNLSAEEMTYVSVQMDNGGIDQSFNQSVETKLILDEEIYDTLDEFNTSTYTFTAKNSGYYLVVSRVAFAVSADGDTIRTILVHDGGNNRRTYSSASSGRNNSVVSSSIKWILSGESIHLEASNNTNNALIRDGDGTGMEIARIF